MHLSLSLPFTILVLSPPVFSTPVPDPGNYASSSSSRKMAVARAATTSIYLAGDSTMAPNGGGKGTQGWGEYLQYSFASSNFTVHNQAVAGRSARSYTRENGFASIATSLAAGDWVVVEFGHNDGGSLSKTDNGRTDCPGSGNETCQTTYNGVQETVYTFPEYLRNATGLFLAKGANVVLSSATPNNVWESGNFSWEEGRFDTFPELVASQVGGPDAGVYYVPHGAYAAQAMKNMGKDLVDENYPNDHTHTAPYLADIMAKAFVLGLKCGTSQLGQGAVNSTESLTSTVLGACLDYNTTSPV